MKQSTEKCIKECKHPTCTGKELGRLGWKVVGGCNGIIKKIIYKKKKCIK